MDFNLVHFTGMSSIGSEEVKCEVKKWKATSAMNMNECFWDLFFPEFSKNKETKETVFT